VAVRVVTDSAADIPADLARSKNITVVPLTVRFGSESFMSGVELGPDEFWEKLRTTPEPPATAAPSAGDFQQAYERLIAEGADGIVSIHISSKLSATYQSAAVASKEVSGKPIEVIDTLGVSAGQGLLVLHAAERAGQGADAKTIAGEIERLAPRVRLFGTIDTLEYLRRGGRIGGAQALLGTMLKFKPVIGLEDGIVEPIGRVRTRGKALEHIVDIVKQDAAKIDRLVVVSANAPDTDRFLELLDAVIHVEPSDVWAFGPIVGTHAGPGVIGVAYILAGD
jgi:DegV family protein with EDD domain